MSTPFQSTAPVTKLTTWKRERRNATPGKALIPNDQFNLTQAEIACAVVLSNTLGGVYGEYQRSVRKVTGIRPSDKLVAVAVDVNTVRPSELVAVAIENECGYQIGFLRRDSLTQWFITIGSYEGKYFHPSSIRKFLRVVDGLRNGYRLALKCHITEAPSESARIILFPSQPWQSVGAVAAGIIAAASATRTKRRKGARP
ncbi:MAG TPA: hypothetical protein VF528_09835 [Pyrinomonadaceae bacterium]|jgi:hypothetical protein